MIGTDDQYTDSLKPTANKSPEEDLDNVVRHPTGIGTFGFANSVNNCDSENKAKNIPAKVPDYFRQGLENGGKKLGKKFLCFYFQNEKCKPKNIFSFIIF